MATDKVVVDPEFLHKQINNHGRVVLEGLHFDTDSARLKPQSLPVVKTIAEYLKSSPGMKFYIVGHTDDTGTEQHNLKLSQDRAEAVQDVLHKQFQIDKTRLKARGAGPWVPKASNTHSQGRSLNRRVELVLSNQS